MTLIPVKHAEAADVAKKLQEIIKASPHPKSVCWFEFRKGKTKRTDVQEFGRYAERNIFRLHRDLTSQKYRHGEYTSFYIHDPKLRPLAPLGVLKLSCRCYKTTPEN